MVSWKLSAVALVLMSAMMASVITKLEASFNLVASHATMITHYRTMADDKTEGPRLEQGLEILRDSFLLSWIVGGCIPGACVGIWIRALTKMAEIAKTFGVSLFTSFCASPWIIRNYFTPSPETCLLVGFLMAVGAWLAWEIALAIGVRIKDAAVKNGWIGVKTEIFGSSNATVSTAKTTSPIPQASAEQKPS